MDPVSMESKDLTPGEIISSEDMTSFLTSTMTGLLLGSGLGWVGGATLGSRLIWAAVSNGSRCKIHSVTRTVTTFIRLKGMKTNPGCGKYF